jgi:hypothetical protein
MGLARTRALRARRGSSLSASMGGFLALLFAASVLFMWSSMSQVSRGAEGGGALYQASLFVSRPVVHGLCV